MPALSEPSGNASCEELDNQLFLFAGLRRDDNTDENTTEGTLLEKRAAGLGINLKKTVALGEALKNIKKHGEENWVWFLTMYFYQVRSPV